jgi:hypothetical protein
MVGLASPAAGYAGRGVMPGWRVDYIGKGGKHLGTVEAPDERSAIQHHASASV